MKYKSRTGKNSVNITYISGVGTSEIHMKYKGDTIVHAITLRDHLKSAPITFQRKQFSNCDDWFADDN